MAAGDYTNANSIRITPQDLPEGTTWDQLLNAGLNEPDSPAAKDRYWSRAEALMDANGTTSLGTKDQTVSSTWQGGDLVIPYHNAQGSMFAPSELVGIMEPGTPTYTSVRQAQVLQEEVQKLGATDGALIDFSSAPGIYLPDSSPVSAVETARAAAPATPQPAVGLDPDAARRGLSEIARQGMEGFFTGGAAHAAEAPAPEEPAAGPRAPEEPTAEAPAPEEPAAGPRAPEEPTTEAPAPEEPTAGPRAPEEPTTEAPAPEEPANDNADLIAELEALKQRLQDGDAKYVGPGAKGITDEESTRTVQEAIKALNPEAELGASGPESDGVDGKFGTKTYQETLKYQQEHGLSSDGQVGAQTLDSMIESLKTQQREVEAQAQEAEAPAPEPETQAEATPAPETEATADATPPRPRAPAPEAEATVPESAGDYLRRRAEEREAEADSTTPEPLTEAAPPRPRTPAPEAEAVAPEPHGTAPEEQAAGGNGIPENETPEQMAQRMRDAVRAIGDENIRRYNERIAREAEEKRNGGASAAEPAPPAPAALPKVSPNDFQASLTPSNSVLEQALAAVEGNSTQVASAGDVDDPSLPNSTPISSRLAGVGMRV